MSRKKTTIYILEDIWERIWRKIDRKKNAIDQELKTKNYHLLQHELTCFLKKESIKQTYPTLVEKFNKGVTYDMIRRALGDYSPGASPELCDLIALWITDEQYTFNKMIELDHPRYKSFYELNETNRKTYVKKDNSIIDRLSKYIYNQVTKNFRKLYKKASPNEREILLMQVSGANEIDINDPNFPEFPPNNPKFPASKTYKINVPGFTNVYLKDESSNPTGTHKDRMSHEVALNCKKYKLEEISIISAGSAAFSIQYFLKLYGLKTKLHVLMDLTTSHDIKQKLEDAGCHVELTDLKIGPLRDKQISELAKCGPNAVDITYRETMDINSLNYYDWLSYEILNENPEFCLIPFGTGDLYINIIKTVNKEFVHRKYRKDRRFTGNLEIITKCCFLGATTENPNSKMDKLFSHHLPSKEKSMTFLQGLIEDNIIDKNSSVKNVEEEFLDSALEIAHKESIKCEPSGIAGLALLLKLKDTIPSDSKILIINTGLTDYQPLV